MVSSVKHIASRYLETINGVDNSSGTPLQPSSKLNTLTTPSKYSVTSEGSSFRENDPLTPRRVSNLQKSLSQLKLESPSPLKKQTSTITAVTGPRVKTKGYEYLCRVGEAKKWMEQITGEEIPPETELANNALRDGVILAKLTKSFKPELVKKIVPPGRNLQFMHTENINVFFHFLDYVKMPDLFRFELTDLYDKKNIPKVIFCIHALSFILSDEFQNPKIENLNGKLDFSEEDIKKSETSIRGLSLPNFESMNKQFGHELPKSPVKNSSRAGSSFDSIGSKSIPVLKPISAKSSSRILDNPFLERNNQNEISKFKIRTNPEAGTASNLEAKVIVSPSELNTLMDVNPSPTKKKKLSESEYLTTIIKFQAISRGSIFRYKMFVDKIILRSLTESIVQLQSIIRTSLIKRRLISSLESLGVNETKFVQFQALVRGYIQRLKMEKFKDLHSDAQSRLFQGICRGKMIRTLIKENLALLEQSKSQTIELQSLIRRNKIYRISKQSSKVQEPLIKFQSHIRRYLYQKKVETSRSAALSSEDAIICLQSIARASKIRARLEMINSSLELVVSSIKELQTISRGGLSRNKLNHILDVLDFQEPKTSKLVSIIRGNLLRKVTNRQQRDIYSQTTIDSIIKVQSRVRGVLSRFGYDLFIDSLEFYTTETVGLQSSIRGYLYRKTKTEVMEYYKQHLDAIIKIQSALRGKYLGDAYKSLISMENPPLSVIKKFAYLLNDSDVDFDEEVKLTRIKESINDNTKNNEKLEKHISQLDLKIALLQKNKITLDELLIQKNKSINNTGSNISTIDVTSLNRRVKTRMELYEKLFYLLETQPNYLTRLINNDYRGVDIALKIFQISEQSANESLPTREEYLYVRLIENTIKDFVITKCHSVDDFVKISNTKNTGWLRLFQNYNESLMTYSKFSIGPILDDIISNTTLDLEYDPLKLYSKIHGLNRGISVDQAIEDDDTKTLFISNLQQLREYVSRIFKLLNENFQDLPMNVRLLCKCVYKISTKKFPRNLEQEHLANAGFLLISGFVKLGFQSPLINTTERGGYSSKNLELVLKLLSQLFSMKPFSNEDIYLQPLNKFINSSVNGVCSLVKSLIDVGDVDGMFNMSIYDDMVAHNRPKLTLRISDMLSINELVSKKIDVLAPMVDDSLREILIEIKSINSSDIMKINGFYTLNLNPSIMKTSDKDTRMKSLFMQAKRCVLYLIQVQDDYNDLFELLKSKIDTIDELKFGQIIQAEKKDIQLNRVNEYINDGQGFLGDLSTISYHKLKQIALERILELESLGYLTRKDSFQVLLNEIANDIKTKHDQRLSRKHQLKIADVTLLRLFEKHKFLKDQLDNYNLHIDKFLEELQLKPSSKPKRILPFTKQFFYERELKKNGKLPKFGAFKYSSKKLYEKGILIEIKNGGPNNQESVSFSNSSSSFFGSFNLPKVDFMFNCNKAGIFEITTKSGSVSINGGLETLTIDQLLEYQFENKSFIVVFGGIVKFDTNCLINFIFKKFYHYEES